METTHVKSRTPSRCREWERQRRIKFNEAITKLGDVIKEITKTTDATNKDTNNIQYPKVEIVQKAIICLNNYIQEKTQLKAEILALQVELDLLRNKNAVKKDASTQVFLSLGRKCQYDKNMKLYMLQKSKRNALKEKTVLTTNQKVLSEVSKQPIAHKLPKLLPRSNISNDKKPSENTIVVLPAAPYIFHQRPLLFPTVPPAIVLVDPNLQTLNKFSGSVVNRNNGDVTKTTMVNILPISAYSRPLSATKAKKTIKSKKENSKKTQKIEKKVTEKLVESTENKDTNEDKSKESSKATNSKITNSNNTNDASKKKNFSECIVEEPRDINNKSESSINKLYETKSSNVSLTQSNKETISEIDNIDKIQQSKPKDVIEVPKNNCNSNTLNEKITLPTTSEIEKTSNNNMDNENISLNKFNKTSDKVPITVEKKLENKLSNILDTTLCDTAVDGGNARLELAEEFLAASPTAAFLMSFPLVSGNRADSPAEEAQNTIPSINNKDSRRGEGTTNIPNQFFEKTTVNDTKLKSSHKLQTPTDILPKQNEVQKYTENHLITKQTENKTTNTTTNSNISNENPFLNLPMPSLISTCTASDSTFGLDFECNISKSIQNQSTSYAGNSNFFYKSDPFNTVKNSIYSTSSISSSHDFNNLGLYPCAMEKYSTKSKGDYSNVEDNLMKIGSSRLTYDIDLGWSHKSFDFVNCTTSSNTFNKDILTNVSAPYSTTYNPFNPEFHVPLVSNSSKKDNMANKANTSFADTITSFYSQPTNLWSEDVPFYTNNSVTKTATTKHQNYLNTEALPSSANTKQNEKHYNVSAKQSSDTNAPIVMKPTNVSVEPQIPEKYTKKSPSKMHINWMTSEIRHMEPNCNSVPIDVKEANKSSYPQTNHLSKKQDHNESYFPISMHNFVAQPTQEEFQMWPSTRTIGPTEITIEPPPINLPTLVGDLALGPHDKKKNSDVSSRPLPQTQDLQNCSNFLSVTQLMNRSSDNMPSRYQVPNVDTIKTGATKQISNYFSNDVNRKTVSSRVDSQLSQPCYGFNEAKPLTTYENMNQFSHSKNKTNKSDKSSKSQKNSYSAEALIRGGSCTQKFQENSSAKFAMSSQKYNEFNGSQDSAIAQVSHFPPIIDYSDNSYTSQQFSGTTLYNTTANNISNSFYSNFMSGSSNLMPSNYTSAPFSSEFIDYSQTECNYPNHKYEELKMRNNSNAFPQDKVPSNYKSSRKESATKHKLECTKKESNKKYQSKRAKLNNEVEEWADPSHHLLWQNKASSKRHSNLVSEELTFPNYVGNQIPTQYQPEFFNSHLMPSNVQSIGHNVDRSLSFPVTSRANFNLSTIFPEITMKVQ